MTRMMHDSVTVADIPSSATMVAGYMDGKFQTVAALQRQFPSAQLVTITVLGTPGAHVCDTEPGNIGIAGAARWAANEVKAGRHPTLYCMASQWKDVKAAVREHGLNGHKVSYWVADYDGDATIPRGAVAKQFADPDLSGGHFDLSVVADHWPGVDDDDRADLSNLSTVYAQRLANRLAHRKQPLTEGRDVLIDLTKEIERVLDLH